MINALRIKGSDVDGIAASALMHVGPAAWPRVADLIQHGEPEVRVLLLNRLSERWEQTTHFRVEDYVQVFELLVPLTLDHDWLQQNLERVRIGSVEDGTAIGSALASSVNRLRDQPSKSKIVVLLTDGQNNAGSVMPDTAAQAARVHDAIRSLPALAGQLVRVNHPRRG